MASPRVYEVTVPEGISVEEGFAEAQKEAKKVGITIHGDTEGGSFSGTASGSYKRDGDHLRFEVEKKPFFVSWKMVESGLRKVFGDFKTA